MIKANEPQMGSDIPATFSANRRAGDHEQREVMIPMRDGVRLYSLIIVPQGIATAPVVLERTPYSAAGLAQVTSSSDAAAALHPLHADLVGNQYILVIQDVRGKFGSEGEYVMNLPLRGPLNDGPADHATDAWDTIEWLQHNLPEFNGCVAKLGLSYDGFTALMSLLEPHPALKACVAMNPMVDCWIGDDFFHNGAFRQLPTAEYAVRQTSGKSVVGSWPGQRYDEYESWLLAGSASGMGQALGLDRLPFWQRVLAHPDYDAHWSGQALDRLLRDRAPDVPTLHVQSLWDAEDIYGAIAAYAAMQSSATRGKNNHLVIGPWSHPAPFFLDGAELGPLKFSSDTAVWFRQRVLLPFLNAHLKKSQPGISIPSVVAFETGSNTWHEYDTWPRAGTATVPYRKLFLKNGFKLTFDPPDSTAAAQTPAFDEFVSNPAKPVTYQPRPIRPKSAPGYAWEGWLVGDQRFASDRPDVLTYTSDMLTVHLRLAGQPVVHLFAATTGTDVDWIIKLIDVQPDEVPGNEGLGGYQLPLAMEILRGRYRDTPSKPSPVPSGEVVYYRIALPQVSHSIAPGHRLMIQVQCSWFPLYDRNPQRYVPRIAFAQPQDYVKATQRVFRSLNMATCIELPVID